MPNKLTPQYALDAAERLGCLPGYPVNPRAIMEIGISIQESCQTEEEVEWLIRELKILNNWPGPGALMEMVRDKFRPRRERTEAEEQVENERVRQILLTRGWMNKHENDKYRQ